VTLSDEHGVFGTKAIACSVREALYVRVALEQPWTASRGTLSRSTFFERMDDLPRSPYELEADPEEKLGGSHRTRGLDPE